jgi:hypothetical protein
LILFSIDTGACGWSASSKDHIAALNTKQYGNTGRRSPDCGRWIRIVNRQTGASTKAQIQGEICTPGSCQQNTAKQKADTNKQMPAQVAATVR